jgi:A/G-specific adenine glycosylase
VALREYLTAQLPTPKPPKSIPTRATIMLILRDPQQRVLLERRGAHGVWSGLWSLPEASDHDEAWRIAQRHAHIDDARTLGSFVHTFSHYRLQVEPLLFDDAHPASAVADAPDLRWARRAELDSLGLPAPVRSLLRNLPE